MAMLIIFMFFWFLWLCHISFNHTTRMGIMNAWLFMFFSTLWLAPADPATFFHDLQPRPLFNDNVIIPYFSDPDFRSVTFEKMFLGVVMFVFWRPFVSPVEKKIIRMSCDCTIPFFCFKTALYGNLRIMLRNHIEYVYHWCAPNDKFSSYAFFVTPTHLACAKHRAWGFMIQFIIWTIIPFPHSKLIMHQIS